MVCGVWLVRFPINDALSTSVRLSYMHLPHGDKPNKACDGRQTFGLEEVLEILKTAILIP